jgi:CRISPR/Cas system-associated exonuclease Cas4 (RecB family)
MIINQKYNYKPLERIDHPSGRKYITLSGDKVPSVTTILSKTKDMSYLNEWRESVGAAEATRIVTESTDIGTSMHALLEKYILGIPAKGQIMSRILADLIIKKGLCNVNEVWGTEVSVYSEGLYAGTTDLVGLHKNTPAIMDFKNSRSEKTKEMVEDYYMQLCAYAIAHNEMFGTNINKGVIMMAVRTGKYQEFVIEGSEFSKYETMWANKVCAYYDQVGRS